ncbi:MAG: hypothetical protein ACP5P3_00015 [Ignavibacteria bacterium]
MRGTRDVKFVIYQVLYIFVVCVIALKGADINLEEVIDVKKVVERSYADSLKRFIDSILALGLVPQISIDTTKQFTLEDLQRAIAEIKKEIPSPEEKKMLVALQPDEMIVKKSEYVPPKVEPELKESKDIQAKVQGVQLTQYTVNKITNPYNGTLEILGDGKLLASIPPKQSATVKIGGESKLTFKVGDAMDVVSTKENQLPQITLQKVGPSGEDASLRSVQGSVGYRIIITDDFPSNLEVSFSGPVITKQVDKNVFDVTLNFLQSETAFDAWSKNKSAPYKVTFSVTVKDKYAPNHTTTRSGTFTFGKW